MDVALLRARGSGTLFCYCIGCECTWLNPAEAHLGQPFNEVIPCDVRAPHGVDLADAADAADVARVCRSHAQWRDMETLFEELVIALADKLWKGARVRELEELVIDRAAAVSGRDRWDLFTNLDALFEEVAAGADERLARSAV